MIFMTDRQNAAALARDFYARKIDFETFVCAVPGEDADDDISELVDLMTHAPQCGGFLGVKKSEHDKYMERISLLIEELGKEE
jgi:hypothetical protein